MQSPWLQKTVFDYYKMDKDLGGIAPGKLADILIFNDLKSIIPSKVFVGGKLVVSNGSLVTKIKKKTISPWIKNTVKLKKFSSDDFVIKSKKNQVDVNTIYMQTEIITKLAESKLSCQEWKCYILT